MSNPYKIWPVSDFSNEFKLVSLQYLVGKNLEYFYIDPKVRDIIFITTDKELILVGILSNKYKTYIPLSLSSNYETLDNRKEITVQSVKTQYKQLVFKTTVGYLQFYLHDNIFNNISVKVKRLTDREYKNYINLKKINSL